MIPLSLFLTLPPMAICTTIGHRFGWKTSPKAIFIFFLYFDPVFFPFFRHSHHQHLSLVFYTNRRLLVVMFCHYFPHLLHLIWERRKHSLVFSKCQEKRKKKRKRRKKNEKKINREIFSLSPLFLSHFSLIFILFDLSLYFLSSNHFSLS